MATPLNRFSLAPHQIHCFRRGIGDPEAPCSHATENGVTTASSSQSCPAEVTLLSWIESDLSTISVRSRVYAGWAGCAPFAGLAPSGRSGRA